MRPRPCCCLPPPLTPLPPPPASPSPPQWLRRGPGFARMARTQASRAWAASAVFPKMAAAGKGRRPARGRRGEPPEPPHVVGKPAKMRTPGRRAARRATTRVRRLRKSRRRRRRRYRILWRSGCSLSIPSSAETRCSAVLRTQRGAVSISIHTIISARC